MLDYKNIIIMRYALGLSFKQLAEEFHASKSRVNDFIRAFEKCEKLSYPLLEGITNYAIDELVYGHAPGSNSRSADYEQPNYEWVFQQMTERSVQTHLISAALEEKSLYKKEGNLLCKSLNAFTNK